MSALRVTVELFADRKGTEQVEVAPGATVADVVEALGLAPEAHVVVRAGDPLPLDAPVADGDALEVLRVVSGGAARP